MSLRAPPATHALPVTATVLDVGFSLLQHRKQFVPVSAFTDSEYEKRDRSFGLASHNFNIFVPKNPAKKGSALSPAKMK